MFKCTVLAIKCLIYAVRVIKVYKGKITCILNNTVFIPNTVLLIPIYLGSFILK